MDATALILSLWIAFAASHIGLASVRVEPRLRAALGNRAFLALYSALSLALFIPLVSIYFGNRHAGETTLWWISVGPGLRALLYALMVLALLLLVAGTLRPSPAMQGLFRSLGGGAGNAGAAPGSRGVYRITRHPVVLGAGLLFGLHLVPFGRPADLAFFGGFLIFSLLGAWHQDARKLHAERSGAPEGAGFAAFCAASPFFPFAGRGALRGLGEIPLWIYAVTLALAVGIRWLHGSIWPH
ncbi:MAG: NnrU family protein [Deltaproteobacteria bacterium]|nr:NnrU family protein [Deltaproteobacteria bacterium]MDD9853643.1 NnrU family protein [Deltaproteobacteria bacterium]MDD9873125.1 NnrU family protein [Deltaproteobacteria bacterium]